jgi:hypothetical protein
MSFENRLRAAALALAFATILPGPSLRGAPVTEEDLFRQVKVDVFDQKWPAVLRGCEEILAKFPSGSAHTQATFYRARALTRIPGREGQGLDAFREFIADHPRDKMMVEEAWAAVFSVACEARAGAPAECLSVLKEGMGSDSDYVKTLAAIRTSDTTDAVLRRRALAILKRAHGVESDPEIGNEILIAILKIDPKEVPSTESARPPRVLQARPSLIRMTVYNKVEKKFELKINLPVAFARMLIEALDADQKREMQREAKQKGIDLDDIFETIERSGAGRLLEVDDATSRIEIWIE